MSNHETITVSAGQTHTVSLGDGDSLEDTLIDITASGAEYRIHANGSDWTIRNVGIRGRMTNQGVATPFTAQGDGLIENVYLGDGGERNGIFIHRNHGGHIDVNYVYFENFATNALYGSPPGNGPEHQAPGNGGTLAVTNCYSANSGVSNFRLGTDGSYLENCVSVGGNRVYWGYYNDTELRDCDLSGSQIVVGENYYATGQNATVTATDSRWDSSINFASSSNSFTGTSAGSPTTAVPEGVPTSATAAATGEGAGAGGAGGPSSGAGGSGGSGGSDGGGVGAIQLEELDVGFDDIPADLEPPAAKFTADAKCDAETLNALNALRDRDEPMDVAIGQFTREDVGITDMSWTVDSEHSGYDVSITLQEHREVHVGEPGLGGGEDQDSESEDGADAADYVQDPDQFEEVPDPETDSTVNLADAGLSDGDVIDEYLDANLTSGTRVEVPAGTYTWNGGGLDGSYENAELVGVEPETETAADGGTIGIQSHPSHVTLEAGDGQQSAHIRVTGGGAGSFHMENIVFSGQRGQDGMLVVSVEAADASALLRRVYLPDGSASGDAIGLLVPESHTGRLHLRNCSVERFANCGVLARHVQGSVHVEGGLYRNNNVADLLLGGDETSAELVTVVNDEPAPDYSGGAGSQRGLWLAGSGTGVRVTDCDFYHAVETGTPIAVPSGAGVSGRVENCRITNDSDRPAAIVRGDVSFTGVHLTGDGRLELLGADAACAGNEGDCERADYSTTAGSSETEVSYDEVVLDAGETRTVVVNSNETLQNIVYDQSADGAQVQIIADGDSWRIRNIAIVGGAAGATRSVIQASVGVASTATIENVYMADGAPAGANVAGIRLPESHAGHLTVRHCNIRGFPTGGVIGHRPGASTGGLGTVDVDGCFFAYNGETAVSMGVNGSSVVNSVIYADADSTPASGAPATRGIWGWYQDTHVTGSNVFVEPTAGPALVGGRHGGSLSVTNGDVRGETEGDVSLNNVGENPQTEVPSGVPTSVAQAAGD